MGTTPIYEELFAATQRSRGLDYSAGRIPASAVLTAGFQFVIRYIDAPGSTNPKLITPDEYRELCEAGVGVLLVFEEDTDDALGGYDQGVAYATRAKAGADALGYNGLIFFCSDMQLSHSQLPTALAYLDGAASVIGKSRVGAYGFWEFIDSAIAADKASAYWQCGIAPASDDPVHLWQRNDGSANVFGVACDINELLRPLPTTEDEMTPEQEAKLDLILGFVNSLYQQMSGSMTLGDWPGWPSLPDGSGGSRSLLDWVRHADEQLCALQTDVSALKTTKRRASN